MELQLLCREQSALFVIADGTHYKRIFTQFSPGMVECGWYTDKVDWEVSRDDGWYHIADSQELEIAYLKLVSE